MHMQDWKELYKMFSDKLLGESSFLYLSVFFFFFWLSKIKCFCFSILAFFFFLSQKSNTIHSYYSLNPLDNLAE